MVQLFAGCIVKVGCKLGERRQFTILRQRGTDTTGQFLHDLGLRCTTHTGYGDTRVNRRTNTGVEQVGFQEDLTIGNGDYVGRNERGNVTRLGFDNRQRGQRTGFPFHFTFGEGFNVFGVNTCSTLQQTRVEVEYVARECFTSWRTTEQQGDLTVSNSLFRQVIVNDQRIFTAVTEVFAHCATGIRCQVLQCSGFRRGCYHNDGVSQCAVLFQFTYHVRNGGRFLADSDIDTFDTGIALVDDGIDSQCGFTCLTVTDDQFTLTTTDWDHGVNGFITGLYRLIYGLTFDNARSDCFYSREAVVIQRTFTVDWCTQSVNHTAQQATANRNFQDTASTLNFHAFGKVSVRTHNNRTYRVALEVQCDSVTVTRQGDHFTLHTIGQAVNADNTVTYRNNSTFVVSFTHNIELSNALLDQFADFGGIQLHAPVPLRLQDVCKALKTTAYAAINDHITRSDDNACHYRLIDFAIQLNFA